MSKTLNPIFPIFVKRREFGGDLEIAAPKECVGTIVAHVMQLLDSSVSPEALVATAMRAFSRQVEAWVGERVTRDKLNTLRFYGKPALTDEDMRRMARDAVGLLALVVDQMQIAAQFDERPDPVSIDQESATEAPAAAAA